MTRLQHSLLTQACMEALNRGLSDAMLRRWAVDIGALPRLSASEDAGRPFAGLVGLAARDQLSGVTGQKVGVSPLNQE